MYIFYPLHLTLGILVWLFKEPTSKNCLEIFSGQSAASVVKFLTLEALILNLKEALTNVKIIKSTRIY